MTTSTMKQGATTTRFNGEVALVTGGTSGIGRATALAFARAGARVVVTGRRREEGRAVVDACQALGPEAAFFAADVQEEREVERLFGDALARFGRLDAAFLNAGTEGVFGPLLTAEAAEFDRTVATNLRGVWLTLRAAARIMAERRHGAIVTTSSWLAVGAFAGSTAYSASKGGVDALVRAAAVELAESGVRVNSVQPGYIVTEMFRRFLDPEDRVTGAPFLHATPMRRYGAPEEIARAVVWLCSDESSYVTGQTLAIDGGLTVPGNRTAFVA